MKSRITVEVDFSNNNQPILQIIKMDSDDVRDRLVAHFTEQLGGSSWLTIKWVGNKSPEPGGQDFDRIHIAPIRPEQFKEQAEIMLEQSRVFDKFHEAHKKDYKANKK